MDTNPLFTIALGLSSPWKVVRTTFDADRKRLDLEVDFTAGSTFVCPECRRGGCPVYDSAVKRWRHLDFFQHQAFIEARVPRVRCESCGVHQVPVPWSRPGSGFTLLMEALILELVRCMPVRNVAELLRVSPNRIWRCVRYYVDAGLRRTDARRVARVGVDETAVQRGHDYVSLFYDLDARRLLFGTSGREHGTIAAFARFLGAHGGDAGQVTEVACDMAPAFRKGVQEHLPNASITFDRFHVTKLLTDALDRVRRREWRKDKTVKGLKYALIKNPENLTPTQRAALTDLEVRNASLAEAYRIKESFRDLYRQPDLASAHGFLKGWLTMALASSLAPIRTAATTIRERGQGILRWYQTGLTTAVMEGLNSLIQAAKRKARGYKTHRTFLLMAYLIAGKLDLRVRA
jgi:transposase